MIIHNINLNNRFIDYKDEKIDLNVPGIYLILGANGTGKTTLLESIVFDDLDITFPSHEMEWYYHFERYKLISYVQQNVTDCDMSVENYILKDNLNVNLDLAKELLNELEFDENNYSENVQKLSGGERLKVSLVAALIKDTPYLFLDEPTNYLDDATVKCMIKILQEYAKNTVIVIVSHDERIMNMEAIRYVMNGKTIHRESMNPVSNEKMIRGVTQKAKLSFRKIAWRRINRPLNYAVWSLIIITSFCLTFLLQYFYYMKYNDEIIPSPNLIAVYSVDYAFGELNQNYCAVEGLEISDTVKHNMINIDDVPNIAELSGCKDIYIQDTPKYMEFASQLNRQIMKDNGINGDKGTFDMELHCFALPEVITRDQRFLNLVGMMDFSYLTNGRLPKDNADEVSISVRLLQKYFGFSKEEAENAIGRTLTYEGNQYEIVGIQYIDVCIISYQNSLENCGVYHYDSATFSQFKEYYNTYIKENGIVFENLEALAITTEFGMEKSVLNNLIQTFPASNYYSSAFAEMWAKETNRTFVCSIWVIVPIVSLVIGICFLMLQRRQIVLNMNNLNEYNRYYINNRHISRHYCVLNLLFCVIILMFNIVFAILINHMFNMVYYVLPLNLLCIILLLLPSTLYVCRSVLYAKMRIKQKSDEK